MSSIQASNLPDKHERRAGILMHPTSLPSRWGIGDLGPAAVHFLEWAAAAGQKVWQVLPLGPTGPGGSPYDATSAFAGNPILISPDRLVDEGLLPGPPSTTSPSIESPDSFAPVVRWKENVIRESWEYFRRKAPQNVALAWQSFRDDESKPWLDEWTLFRAIKHGRDERPWYAWEPELANHDDAALRNVRLDLAGEIEFRCYEQFLFRRQWQTLRQEARRLGIEILGDIPIYVAHDSADTWSRQDLFHLDANGRPTVVAGVPPDYFSEDGQRWGNPLYRWDRLEIENFRWWVDRVRAQLELADFVRLDHFRGFAAYWEIPSDEATARNGRWVDGPGSALFDALRNAIGSLPFVAEDLGTITEDVTKLRQSLGVPGMRVAQFGFNEPESIHHPDRWERGVVGYTGTHDNDTTRGWYGTLEKSVRGEVDRLLGTHGDISWRMIEAVLGSRAELVIIPMQDVLALDSDSRMNRPGESEGNWSWRVSRDVLTRSRADDIRRLVVETGRLF